MRWWPRTVRWQLIIWLMLLEALSVGLFATILVNIEGQEIRQRALERLAHQATSLALQAEEAYRQQHPELVLPALRMMGEAPSVAQARITDAAGNVTFVSEDEAAAQLSPEEKAQIALIRAHEPRVFSFGNGRREGVKAIYDGANIRGYAWVEIRPLVGHRAIEDGFAQLVFVRADLDWRIGIAGAADVALHFAATERSAGRHTRADGAEPTRIFLCRSRWTTSSGT